MDEFDLIRRFFTQRAYRQTRIGVGDDCAYIAPSKGARLLTSTDSMAEGTHFTARTPPRAIGHKLATANISDIFAGGGRPKWALLNLTIPTADSAWLAEFSEGLLAQLARFEVDVIGGDTARGAYHVALTLFGEVATPLTRTGAKAGDVICLSNTMLGSAARGLAYELRGAAIPEPFNTAFYAPEPSTLGAHIADMASAALDVSDGLLQDLAHLLRASGERANIELGADLESTAIPRLADTPLATALTGGEDYALCFTVPRARMAELAARCNTLQLAYHTIGVVSGTPGIRVDGKRLDDLTLNIKTAGFRHFD